MAQLRDLLVDATALEAAVAALPPEPDAVPLAAALVEPARALAEAVAGAVPRTTEHVASALATVVARFVDGEIAAWRAVPAMASASFTLKGQLARLADGRHSDPVAERGAAFELESVLPPRAAPPARAPEASIIQIRRR